MKKKNQKITLAVIVLIIVSYFVAGFALRNKSPLWCHLSLGAFDLIEGGIGAKSFPGGIDSERVYECEGGIFSILK